MCWDFIFFEPGIVSICIACCVALVYTISFFINYPVAVKVKQLDFAKQKFYENVAKRKA